MDIKKIKSLMKERKLSQTKLALLLHTDKSNVCNKLAGRRGFSFDDVKKMKLIFNLSVEEAWKIFID